MMAEGKYAGQMNCNACCALVFSVDCLWFLRNVDHTQGFGVVCIQRSTPFRLIIRIAAYDVF